MALLENRIYGLWAGKQIAKGTPNVAPGKRLVQVGGDFASALDVGSENYSDLQKYGAQTDWVNNLTGTGEPAIEATPTELAYLLWLYHGAEVVTAVPGPPAASKHTFTPSSGRGHWTTFAKRVGLTNIIRQRFADSLVSRIQIEGSTANKAVRITPRAMSLDPGETFAADPVAGMPTDKAFLYTDGSAAFMIDDQVFRGQSQFTFVADEDLQPVYGDDVVPHELAQGNATVTIAVTVLMDDVALALWNTWVYGAAAPAEGTKPKRTIPALGSYEFSLKQRDDDGELNGREFALAIPGVRWTPPEAPAPNPDGGSTEIALSGSMRPLPATPAYTLDVYTDPAALAFTV